MQWHIVCLQDITTTCEVTHDSSYLNIFILCFLLKIND